MSFICYTDRNQCPKMMKTPWRSVHPSFRAICAFFIKLWQFLGAINAENAKLEKSARKVLIRFINFISKEQRDFVVRSCNYIMWCICPASFNFNTWAFLIKSALFHTVTPLPFQAEREPGNWQRVKHALLPSPELVKLY